MQRTGQNKNINWFTFGDFEQESSIDLVLGSLHWANSLSTWSKRLIVSRTWVSQIVVDQHTKGRLKLWVLFNLGLTHVPAPLLLHLPIGQAKESFPLKTGRQRNVPKLPASRQLSSLLQKEIKRDSGLKTLPTMANSNSLAAASCLTVSLGFLATHLAIKLLKMLQNKYREFSPGEDCAVAEFPLLVHPASPLRLCHTHQKVQNISTSKLSLTPKALAMVRLLSLMMGKPAWAEADH